MLESGPDLPQWYAAYTTPRHEKHVFEMLAEHELEAVLPLYRTMRQWKKSRPVQLELPLFPCYLFVRTTRANLGKVLAIPGVLSIVGSGRGPWPLPPVEIEALRLGAQLGTVEPHSYLSVGQKVRIRKGPMRGTEGILERKKNEFRFVMTLDAIMKSFAIDVNPEDLEVIEEGPEPFPPLSADHGASISERSC